MYPAVERSITTSEMRRLDCIGSLVGVRKYSWQVVGVGTASRGRTDSLIAAVCWGDWEQIVVNRALLCVVYIITRNNYLGLGI